MIYSYTYLDHDIQKFHIGVYGFFEKLFELDLPNLDINQHIADWFQDAVQASPSLLQGNFQTFVVNYHGLQDPAEKENLRRVFEANQNIKSLCDGSATPMKYTSISNQTFQTSLKEFFISLWKRLGSKERGVNLQVETLCGKIGNHYQQWRQLEAHQTKLCPFCGLYTLLPSVSPHRPAYDHYLPEAQYPFVSVNFENLVPMCHDCNSYEKSTKDPLSDNGESRVVFYPYDTLPEDHFEPSIVAELYNIERNSTLLRQIGWSLSLSSTTLSTNQLKSWDSIFRLKGRYQDILHEYEKTWFDEIKNKFKSRPFGQVFEVFRNNYLSDIRKEICYTERSIVRYAYASFLLHETGFEEDLNLLIAA